MNFKFNIVLFVTFLLYGCQSTDNAMTQEDGFIKIVVAIPSEKINEDGGDMSKPTDRNQDNAVYLLNQTPQQITLCDRIILAKTAISLSLTELKHCGGALQIDKSIKAQGYNIIPSHLNKRLWLITEKEQ